VYCNGTKTNGHATLLQVWQGTLCADSPTKPFHTWQWLGNNQWKDLHTIIVPSSPLCVPVSVPISGVSAGGFVAPARRIDVTVSTR